MTIEKRLSWDTLTSTECYCFYLCFSNDLEDWNPGRNVIFLTGRLGLGEEMFPPSGDRKSKPKQQHLLYKTRD